MSAVDPMGELLPNEQTAEEDDLTKSIETFTPSHSTSMNDLPKEEQVVTILSDEISLPTLNALTSSPYWEDNRDNGGATDNEFNYGTNSSSADNENSKATNTNLTFHPSELARGNIESKVSKSILHCIHTQLIYEYTCIIYTCVHLNNNFNKERLSCVHIFIVEHH